MTFKTKDLSVDPDDALADTVAHRLDIVLPSLSNQSATPAEVCACRLLARNGSDNRCVGKIRFSIDFGLISVLSRPLAASNDLSGLKGTLSVPPPKKAAKKTAKKAAKKAVGNHRDKVGAANDLLRAYEHMGRVTILQQSSESSVAHAVAELTTLAQQAIKEGNSKAAADLLRASEHLSFAAMASKSTSAILVSAELKQSITERFDELTRRGDEHWAEEDRHSNIVAGIYESSRKSASKAFEARAYHEALEYGRAAEALAHVEHRGPIGLVLGRKNPQLKGV